MNWIGKQLAKHFGGGVMYIYLAVAGVIAFQWGYINYLNARLDTVKIERDTARKQSAAKGAVANSLGRQKALADQHKKDLDNVSNDIANADNPLEFTYEWLRNKRRREADNTDQ